MGVARLATCTNSVPPSRRRRRLGDSASRLGADTPTEQPAKMVARFVALALALLCVGGGLALREGDCEVCVKTVDRFAQSLSEETKKDFKKIEDQFKKYCKTTKNKENRFCYYLGGLEESATGILGELSKPLSWSMPADKICEKLKKKDAQICDLRYDKEIDLDNVDLKKLKVRDLKKILNDWDETCEGCIEKTDFIKRIEELKPQHVQRTEL